MCVHGFIGHFFSVLNNIPLSGYHSLFIEQDFLQSGFYPSGGTYLRVGCLRAEGVGVLGIAVVFLKTEGWARRELRMKILQKYIYKHK